MKKSILGILPVKEWITLDEAMCYTSCGRDKFNKIFLTRVSINLIGDTKVYKVSDLKKIIEENILIAC